MGMSDTILNDTIAAKNLIWHKGESGSWYGEGNSGVPRYQIDHNEDSRTYEVRAVIKVETLHSPCSCEESFVTSPIVGEFTTIGIAKVIADKHYRLGRWANDCEGIVEPKTTKGFSA